MRDTERPILPENLTVEAAIASWKQAQKTEWPLSPSLPPLYEAGELHGVITRVRVKQRPRPATLGE